MKCTKCGAEMADGVFCSKCGNKLFNDHLELLEAELQENTFIKFGYSKKDTTVLCVSAVFFGIYFMVCVIMCMLIEVNFHIKISGGRYIVFSDSLKGAFSFMAIVLLIGLISIVVRVIVFRKVCLCLYNNKITGVSTKNMAYATECFEIKYTDIIDIKQKRNLITIETGTKIFKCFVQDAQKAYEMILRAKNR